MTSNRTDLSFLKSQTCELFPAISLTELIIVIFRTTVKIQTMFCPELKTDGRKKLVKQIDGAIGLRLTQQEIQTLEAANFHGTRSINAVDGDFMNLTSIWNHIEVKRPNTDKDPGVQLSVWGSAEFSKREYEEIDLAMPIISTSIVGDNWLMYITYAVEVDGKFQRTVSLGPTPIGDTLTMDGVFKILCYYCRAATWALAEYKAWFRRAVMEKFGHKYTQT